MYLCSDLFFSFHTRLERQIGFSRRSVGDSSWLCAVVVKQQLRAALKCAKTKRATTNSFFHIRICRGGPDERRAALQQHMCRILEHSVKRAVNISIVYHNLTYWLRPETTQTLLFIVSTIDRTCWGFYDFFHWPTFRFCLWFANYFLWNSEIICHNQRDALHTSITFMWNEDKFRISINSLSFRVKKREMGREREQKRNLHI